MAPKSKFGTPDKTPDPVLVSLISQFLSNHGFDSSLRILTTERQKRAKKGTFTDTYGAKQTKGLPQLDVIFKEYVKQNKSQSKEESSDDESTSDESEAEQAGADVEMADGTTSASSESGDDAESSSDSSSSESSSESEEEKPQPVTQVKSLKRKASSSASASSSSSSASSESSESEDEKRPSKRTKVQPVAPEPDRESSASSSSSSSESESEADSESEAGAAAIPLPESESSDSSAESDSDSDSEPSVVKKADSSDSSSSDSSDSSDSSESDSEEDEEDKVVPEPAPKATELPRASSDSSATLQGDPAPLPPWPGKQRGARPTRLAELSANYDANDPSYIDNTYVSYDYADRAYKDLSVTRGKGFTKEKNKKKRGSYRGGAIDTSGGKAFKFDD